MGHRKHMYIFRKRTRKGQIKNVSLYICKYVKITSSLLNKNIYVIVVE